MEMSFDVLFLLAATGFVAATIDAIAGGGGLLTIPVLMSVGIPPHFVLGTNKFQSSCGTFIATLRYARHGLIDWKQIWPAAAGAFAGGVAGTLTVQQIDPDILKPVVPFLLMAMAVYFLLSKRLTDKDSHGRMGVFGFALSFAPVIGFYDGFFGPGTGSFFSAAIIAFLGYGAQRAAANTRLLNLMSNWAALLTFLWAGQIYWEAALIMAGTAIVGGATGARLGLKHGGKLIKPVLVTVSIALSLKLLWAQYGS